MTGTEKKLKVSNFFDEYANLKIGKNLLTNRLNAYGGKYRPIIEASFSGVSQFESKPGVLNKLEEINTLTTEFCLEVQEGKGKIEDYPVFPNIYSIIFDPYLLIVAYCNIARNKGSMTSGIDKKTIEDVSLDTIIQIHLWLKFQEYKANPVVRVDVPKAGKPFPLYKRPLGIPTIYDRIVQEAVRIVLDFIYEPLFKLLNCNYGFRAQHSCHHAIISIQRHSKASTFAIEVDVKGAYDNVNHKILIQILQEIIPDRKFLNLIRMFCKAGIFEDNVVKNSFLGVPQEGIASPILFNIYMTKFDRFVLEEINRRLSIINATKKRTHRAINPAYERVQYQLSKLRKKKCLMYSSGITGYKYLTPSQKLRLKDIRRLYKKLIAERRRTPSTDYQRGKVRMFYVRYADDCVIFIAGTRKMAVELKERLGEWLKLNLKLTLSEEKTLITDCRRDYVKFLGFAILIQETTKRIISPTIIKNGVRTKAPYTTRTAHHIKQIPYQQFHIHINTTFGMAVEHIMLL
eukprot:TRINITY_DN577_c0_g2_i3.p2 TRINITY_DN577_c0_g2~~TRINITY_DN577_c0_g2_i3.p2  ORF type:complete len:516 (+),score=19.23 TRINITY_DN577_c0_g2_i3:886-2433(+)